MSTIKTEALRAALARRPCDEQWEIVEDIWPDEIPLTMETLARARELDLDLEWLGHHLPDTIRTEYRRVRAVAWSEYGRTSDVAWAPALAEYVRVRNAALLDAVRRLAKVTP